MTPRNLVDVAVNLLIRFGQFAQHRDPATFWREVSTWLLEQTAATGVWLELPDPTPLILSPGKWDKTSLAFLAEWTAKPALPPENGIEIRRFPNAALLCISLPAKPQKTGVPGQQAGYLALGFPPEQDFPAEAGTQLQAALQVLITIARQTAILHQTQDRLSRFQHLYEVGQAISSTLDLDQVLQQSTERMAEVLHAEASTLMLVDEAKGELTFKVPAGPAEHVLREQHMPINAGIAGWVATHGEPLIIPDVSADDRFYKQIDSLSGFRTHSIMAVPLQVKGRTIGIAEVINKANGEAFTPDDLQWLSILTPLVAAAIENARLFAALREENDRIIAAEEQVRHELARDLHDGPAQILSAIILNIDMARRQLAARPEKMATELNFLDSLAQEANHEVRDLLFSLRPLALETHGLAAALRQLAERELPRAPYQLNLDVSTLPEEPLDPGVANTLFVIVQEALNNIYKHANAQNVWIRLGTTATHLWMEVNDDGIGFDVKQVDLHYSQRNSFGLLNMRERARLIDGKTEIRSPAPGRDIGTQVRVEVPLERAYPGQ